MSETGTYLAQLREGRKLSKYTVASRAGVSHSNIFKFEHGQRLPTPDVIARLRGVYDLTQTEEDTLIAYLAADLLMPYRKEK